MAAALWGAAAAAASDSQLARVTPSMNVWQKLSPLRMSGILDFSTYKTLRVYETGQKIFISVKKRFRDRE